MYYCVVYASNLWYFLISWPDWAFRFHRPISTAHPFRLHLWPPKVVRGHDGHVTIARGRGSLKPWRLQGCLSLSNLVSKFIQGSGVIPPEVTNSGYNPARLRNRTWSHGGLVQMIFRTSRGIFSGSMLLFRGVSKNGRMRLKPEIRCFTSFYILCIILWYPFFVDFNCVDYPYGRNGTMQIYGKFGGFWGIALQDAWFGLVIITTAVDFVHIRTILTCRDRLFHG